MGIREFTDKAKSALKLAHESAASLGHVYVGSEHVMLGLLREREGVAASALRVGGVTEDAFLKRLTDTVGRGEPGQKLLQGLTPRGRHIMNIAASEAARLGQDAIGTEHLLLGILHDGEGMAAQLLTSLGIDIRKLYAGIVDNVYLQPLPPASRLPGRPKPQRTDTTFGEQTIFAAPKHVDLPKTLGRFGRDLTAAAHRLDPVVGRGEEITRVMQILARRQKNNPVLLGEPGVGKTAVVEGLACRIATGDVPEDLADKRIVTLDLSSMVAGTKYRGEFEERFKQVMEEAARSHSIILFIDEMHTLVGAGAAEGAIDAANILKPALARGELQMIGATTLEEYRRHIEKDAALERRFQPVTVGEPSEEEAERILLGLRSRYEEHHRVRITDEAIRAAVELSTRYIADRFLPDKALDLIDEACSRRRLEGLDVHGAKQEVMRLIDEKEAALNRRDMETAAVYREAEYEARAEMEVSIEERRAVRRDRAEIGPDDVAAVVAVWTGIPVARLTEDETRKLLEMEALLHRRVIGQEQAVSAVTRAVRRGRMGLKDPKRPVGSFLFLGPSGVGKTELCRALAEAQFGHEDALTRVDMSELMERHSGAKLIGAPPGYVGYNEGGGLTEKVRRRPHSVVLFDEIEKAHPDVLALLLQVLEDGRLTDSAGRRVDFRNTILVMTTNLGAKSLSGKAALGFAASDGAGGDSRLALDELRRALPPEFLSRVDDIVTFSPLMAEQARQVARLMLEPVRKRLFARGIELEISGEALNNLATRGLDPEHGIRPLRGIIQSEIEDVLSEKLLEGQITGLVTVEADNERLKITAAG